MSPRSTPAAPSAAALAPSLRMRKIHTLRGLLRSWGYPEDDFVIEEDPSPALADLFGLSGGIVRVSRRSTGAYRLYATGMESAWISSLLLDLARGHLADAPDGAAAPLVDVAVPAPTREAASA